MKGNNDFFSGQKLLNDKEQEKTVPLTEETMKLHQDPEEEGAHVRQALMEREGRQLGLAQS